MLECITAWVVRLRSERELWLELIELRNRRVVVDVVDDVDRVRRMHQMIELLCLRERIDRRLLQRHLRS